MTTRSENQNKTTVAVFFSMHLQSFNNPLLFIVASSIFTVKQLMTLMNMAK